MPKTKKKKLRVLPIENLPVEENKSLPINDVPEPFLQMHVKSGTKMRNVLQYALEHFANYNAIVWSAVGQGVSKGISCAELFKRKHPGLHQVTRLRYTLLDSKSDQPEKSNKSRIPEIHILLSKTPTHMNDPGYQGPADLGNFAELGSSNSSDKSKDVLSKQREQGHFSGKITNLAAEEFAAMGLRTGQKRSRKQQHAETPLKKNKKKRSTDT